MYDDVVGRLSTEAEVVRDRERKRDARRVIGEVDGRAQMFGSRFGVRVDVERWRQPPGVAARVEEPVVAQVVVGVGDEDGEDDAAPELVQVRRSLRRAHLDGFGHLQVAALLSIGGPQHRHRAHVADPAGGSAVGIAGPVEPVHDENAAVREVQQSTGRNGDPGPGGKFQRDLLPRHDVPRVVRRAGELGDGEGAVGAANVRFGPRPAQRAADADEAPKVWQVG